MTKPDEDSVSIDRWEVQLRKGTLNLAVLACLWREKLYGLEILRRLEADAGLSIPEGTIYPLMNRLKTDGLVSSEWVEAEAGHPRKYYALTPKGRDAVTWMTRLWWGFSGGLNQLLAPLETDLSSDRRLPGLPNNPDEGSAQ